MNNVTLVRFRSAMESRYYQEKPNDWANPELYTAFKKRFGNQSSLKELIPWLRKFGKHYEAELLSTSDGDLTRACIESGANPNAENNCALLLASEDGDGGSIASLKVLVEYKPSLQALENALRFTLGMSMGSNPETEAILKRHIAIAKKESSKEKRVRAKSVSKGRVVFRLMG